MELKSLRQLISLVSKGDTAAAEALFARPGGRKYIESIVLTVLCSVPELESEKEDLFFAFRKALDNIEKRIKRQKEGQEILDQIVL